MKTVYVPTAPVVVPTPFVIRGDRLVHLITASSIQVRPSYLETNACGEIAYRKGGGSIQINEKIDCITTQQGQMSISYIIPSAGGVADFNALLDALVGYLRGEDGLANAGGTP